MELLVLHSNILHPLQTGTTLVGLLAAGCDGNRLTGVGLTAVAGVVCVGATADRIGRVGLVGFTSEGLIGAAFIGAGFEGLGLTGDVVAGA